MTDNDTDTKPLHGPNLILDVENFGPIAEAKNIEFRPMTVFVGPSNTGKSYLAMLLHAMLQAHRNRRRSLSPSYLRRFVPTEPSQESHSLFSETSDLLTRVGRYESETGEFHISIDDYSEKSRQQISDLLNRRVRDITRAYANEINDFFEVEHIDELRLGSDGALEAMSIILRDSNHQWSLGPDLETSVGLDNLHFAFRERLAAEMNDGDYFRPLGMINVVRAFVYALERSFGGVQDSIYFPAARTGLLMSHRINTDALLDRAHVDSIEGREQYEAPHHRVARDFLRLTNGVVETQRMRRRRSDDRTVEQIAQAVEGSVLGGRVLVEEVQYGPPDFSYSPSHLGSLRVPIHRASAMVTEIAPMVAFLRSYVEVGDLLIVEEPEAHLHPAAQQKMAAVLAYMVRKGIRVLMTTHSHYIVEAMGMFACAAGIDGDARSRSMRLLNDGDDDGNDLDRNLYLNEDEVAIYGFDGSHESGTVVRAVPFDSQSYVYDPTDYSAALVDQFNRVSRVINERFDADELAEKA